MDLVNVMIARQYAGLRPIPVLTRGTPDRDIQRYTEVSDYVAIGGIASTSGAKNAVRWMMQRLPKDIRVHWLGFSWHDYMTYYRPYSVDTSALAVSSRYGDLSIYHGNARWSRTHKTRLKLSARDRRSLTRYGFNPSRLEGNYRRSDGTGNPTNTIADCVNLACFARFAEEVEKQLGTHYHFVCGVHLNLDVQLLQLATNRPCVGVISTEEMGAILSGQGFDRYCSHV